MKKRKEKEEEEEKRKKERKKGEIEEGNGKEYYLFLLPDFSCSRPNTTDCFCLFFLYKWAQAHGFSLISLNQ